MTEHDSMEYSFWVLMNKLYEAKRSYYSSGKSDLTDQEYDALEESIKVIHGHDRYVKYYRVGYCAETHEEVKANAQNQIELFNKHFEEKIEELKNENNISTNRRTWA